MGNEAPGLPPQYPGWTGSAFSRVPRIRTSVTVCDSRFGITLPPSHHHILGRAGRTSVIYVTPKPIQARRGGKSHPIERIAAFLRTIPHAGTNKRSAGIFWGVRVRVRCPSVQARRSRTVGSENAGMISRGDQARRPGGVIAAGMITEPAPANTAHCPRIPGTRGSAGRHGATRSPGRRPAAPAPEARTTFGGSTLACLRTRSGNLHACRAKAILPSSDKRPNPGRGWTFIAVREPGRLAIDRAHCMCNGRSLPDLMRGHSDVLSKLRHQGDNRHKNSYRRKRDLRLFGTGPLPLNLLQIWTHPPPPPYLCLRHLAERRAITQRARDPAPLHDPAARLHSHDLGWPLRTTTWNKSVTRGRPGPNAAISRATEMTTEPQVGADVGGAARAAPEAGRQERRSGGATPSPARSKVTLATRPPGRAHRPGAPAYPAT